MTMSSVSYSMIARTGPRLPVRSAADQVRHWGFYRSHPQAGGEVPDDVK